MIAISNIIFPRNYQNAYDEVKELSKSSVHSDVGGYEKNGLICAIQAGRAKVQANVTTYGPNFEVTGTMVVKSKEQCFFMDKTLVRSEETQTARQVRATSQSDL
jgi:hypothetical protein